MEPGSMVSEMLLDAYNIDSGVIEGIARETTA